MSSVLLALLIFGTLTASFKAQAIIGGLEVNQANQLLTQSVVALYNPETETGCSGTLIDKNIVLTAAHCLEELFLENTFVYFGPPKSSTSPFRQIIDIRISPYWNGDGHKPFNTGDIALVKFSGEAPAGYVPAQFLNAKYEYLLKNGSTVALLGYGVDNPVKKSGSGVLRAVTIKILNTKYSASEVLLDQSSGKGACQGDSGGPAFIYLNKNLYLVGIISRGPSQKNDCSQFSLYTNALVYRSWINSSLAIMR